MEDVNENDIELSMPSISNLISPERMECETKSIITFIYFVIFPPRVIGGWRLKMKEQEAHYSSLFLQEDKRITAQKVSCVKKYRFTLLEYCRLKVSSITFDKYEGKLESVI